MCIRGGPDHFRGDAEDQQLVLGVTAKVVRTTSEAVALTGGVVVRDHTINIGQSSASPIAHWEARGAMDGPDARAQSVPRWTTLTGTDLRLG